MSKAALNVVQREVLFLRRIQHPHVVRLEASMQDEANVYMILELLQGGELFDEIVRGKSFSEADASETMRQIMTAIREMHAQGVCHADLKPENLLLETSEANSILKV